MPLSIIDTSYFFGDLHVPMLGTTANSLAFLQVAEKYERSFLNEFFGEVFAKTILDEYKLPIPSARSKALIEGGSFVDKMSKNRLWFGLKNEHKESPIANYVYFFWKRKDKSSTVEIGELNTSSNNSSKNYLSSTIVSENKRVSAYNEMVEMCNVLYSFLQSKIDQYEELKDHCFDNKFFRKLNMYNI